MTGAPSMAKDHRDGADLILHGGEVVSLAPSRSGGSDRTESDRTEAVAIADGRVLALGRSADVLALRRPDTRVVDLRGHLVVPGLNDSHNHFVRAGRRWLVDLHWEDTRTVAEALGSLRAAATRATEGEWLAVIGGWHPLQFAEQRPPSIEELDAAAPRTPVLIQYAYAWGQLNSAALRDVEPRLDSAPDAIARSFERDGRGLLTGKVTGRSALVWLAGSLTDPDVDTQVRGIGSLSAVLAGYGITGLTDGGGFRSGPASYAPLYESWRRGLLRNRVRLTVHAAAAGSEREDFDGYRKFLAPPFGDDLLQVVGAGEIILYRAHDHPGVPADTSPATFDEMNSIFAAMLADGWTVQTHAHNPELISGLLSSWATLPGAERLPALRWALVHASELTPAALPAALPVLQRLGLGILCQGQSRYRNAEQNHRPGANPGNTPPLRALLDAGIPVALGSDGMTAASYNPFENIAWFVTGRSMEGDIVLQEHQLLSRTEALRGYTADGAWFTFEEEVRGTLEPGKCADLAVLSDDYFSVPEQEIPRLRSRLTVLGGAVVHAEGEFDGLSDLPDARSAEAVPA